MWGIVSSNWQYRWHMVDLRPCQTWILNIFSVRLWLALYSFLEKLKKKKHFWWWDQWKYAKIWGAVYFWKPYHLLLFIIFNFLIQFATSQCMETINSWIGSSMFKEDWVKKERKGNWFCKRELSLTVTNVSNLRIKEERERRWERE